MTDQWKICIKNQCEELRSFIDNIEAELMKYPGEEAYGYIQPIRHLVYEAYLELMERQLKRIKNGSDIIEKL